ncbi:hypothetical protein [Hymenobacter guriensis]|nr:hypothetical protein [Hymenobacter guriensis]
MAGEQQADYFKDYGDGSFRVVEFWILEKDGINNLHCANTLLEWADVSQVQAWPDPNTLPEDVTPEGPKCLVYWCGKEMKLLAPFTQVAKAWRDNRRKARFQHIGIN